MGRARPRILVLRTGHTAPAIVREHGDYDRWFTAGFVAGEADFSVAHVPDQGVPSTAGFDGLLVTGTPGSVREPEEWMAPLADRLLEPSAPPALAVCFAAQLIAWRLGGEVRLNPRGWEIGTVTVDLTAAGAQDPLFQGLPHRLTVQSTHEDAVTGLPESCTLLAGNEHTPVQSFACANLRATQFHPEAGAGVIRKLVELRRPVLEAGVRRLESASPAEARDRIGRLRNSIADTPDGRAVLSNWLSAYVRQDTPVGG